MECLPLLLCTALLHEGYDFRVESLHLFVLESRKEIGCLQGEKCRIPPFKTEDMDLAEPSPTPNHVWIYDPDRKVGYYLDRPKPCASGDSASLERGRHSYASRASTQIAADAASTILYSSTLAVMAPPNELPIRAIRGDTNAEAHPAPPPLRRNNSSLRLLTELTRERISLRSACRPSKKDCLYFCPPLTQPASATCTHGQSCTNPSSSTAMPSLSPAIPCPHRQHVTTPGSLPSRSLRHYVSASAGPL